MVSFRNIFSGGRQIPRRTTDDNESKTGQETILRRELRDKKYSKLLKYKWGFGLEHEAMFFHIPDDKKKVDKMKNFTICDIDAIATRILDNHKKYGLNYSQYDFLLNIPFEKSGRRCKGEWVFKPALNYSMVEFVTTKPFSDFKKGRKVLNRYISELFYQESKFTEILDKEENHVKQTKKYGKIYQYPVGMSSYIKVPTKESRTRSPFTSYKYNKKLTQDYTGSYHITITLPFTPKTSKKVFIDKHKNFANQIQWIEPLLIASFFSGDDTSMGTRYSKIKGSFRVMQVGWGNMAGSDIRNFNKGIGRYSNIKSYWRNGIDFKGLDRLDKCAGMSDAVREESGAISSLSSDFRTFGSTDPKRPWHRESGKGMTKPNGIEIRIFDNFDRNYLQDLCRIMIYLAENSRLHKSKSYVYKNVGWKDAMKNVMENGWLANVSEKFVNDLRKNLGLKIDLSKSSSTSSLTSSSSLHKFPKTNIMRVFRAIVDELFKNHKNGVWTRLFLDLSDQNNKRVPTIGGFNKNSWDIGFILKLRNNKKLYDNFVTLLLTLPKNVDYETFEKMYYVVFNKKTWSKDILNVLFFCYTLKFIDLTMKKGQIVEITSNIRRKDSEYIIQRINIYFRYIISHSE